MSKGSLELSPINTPGLAEEIQALYERNQVRRKNGTPTAAEGTETVAQANDGDTTVASPVHDHVRARGEAIRNVFGALKGRRK